MPMEEGKFCFSPCDPWESLDPLQRALRALRIVVGWALALFFMTLAGMGGLFLYDYPNFGQRKMVLIIVAGSLLQVAAIARTLIWRPERKSPLPRLDENREEEGPDPPPDDAPRPAPLLPHSPKVLSASAPLDREAITDL